MADTIFQQDKLKHLAVCAIAGCFHPFLAIGLALGKEYADKCYNHWCWFDILADTIGTAIGSVVWWMVWR